MKLQSYFVAILEWVKMRSAGLSRSASKVFLGRMTKLNLFNRCLKETHHNVTHISISLARLWGVLSTIIQEDNVTETLWLDADPIIE